MNESILTSVKKLLGITEEYEHFDADIIMHINTVLSVLVQMGVGTSGFVISDKNSKWGEFIGDTDKLAMVKSYVGLKVRMLFDPPLSSSVAEAVNNNISELEWRLYAECDRDTPLADDEIASDNEVTEMLDDVFG